jgi:UDP-N-acetylmuramate--alanine ligase
MGRVENIHFIGIGGSGMCGIAEVLHNEGYCITGSDASESKTTQYLQSLGIEITIGHHASLIDKADVVVRSTAIRDDNPEILAAKQKQIPIIPRAKMLAELMRFRHGIAIAGTHGKTTTTSLVSSVLAEGGLDPSYVIGGRLNSSGSNAQLGKSTYFVAEADESDASFLFLKPMTAVVTNIDADHMGTYEDNVDKLKDTFLEFLHHLPFYGLAILCLDDPGVVDVMPRIERPIITYGFNKNAHYHAVEWVQKGLSSQFTVFRPIPHAPLHIEYNLPGRHNVLNALAAIAVATDLGVSDTDIIEGLRKFQGVGRRFQQLGDKLFEHGTAKIIDDYGHHPQEISSTIDALRHVWPDTKLIHVFQPHRYTRTKALFDAFVDALSLADELVLLDVYSAGEPPIEGANSAAIAQKLHEKGKHAYLANEQTLLATLDKIVQNDNILLMQGAGSIGTMANKLVQNTQEPIS